MVAFTVDSDEVFLHCTDVGVVEVCKIENLDRLVGLVVKAHWTCHQTIQFGDEMDYQMLKIGDKEITGSSLVKVMEDLRDSRFMVNREGRCILRNAGDSSRSDVDVEFYRVLDRFNWFKYQVRSRSQIADNSDLERERLEQRVKSLEKAMKELKRNHQEKLIKIENRRIEELKQKDRQIIDLEKKVFSRSGLRDTEFLSSVATRVRTLCPVYVKEGFKNKKLSYSGSGLLPTAIVMDTSLSKEEVVSLGRIELKASSISEADAENWWAVKISGPDKYKYLERKAPFYATFVYYDGEFGSVPVKEKTDTVPIPVKSGYPSVTNEAVFFLHGIGPRYGSFFE